MAQETKSQGQLYIINLGFVELKYLGLNVFLPFLDREL